MAQQSDGERRITVREAVLRILRDFGVDHLYGNPGSTELPFLAGLPAEFRYVLGLHESVAVGMADGAAQVSGRAAFVNLHTAAGLGNAMGALVNAYHNKSPLVVTAGQQDRRHLTLEPRLTGKLTGLALPYVKWAVEPPQAQAVPMAIQRAFLVALTPPMGPTFVSVPMNDWDEVIDTPPLERQIQSAGGLPDDMRARLVSALADSRSPAIVAGPGVSRARSWPALRALSDLVDADVWLDPGATRFDLGEVPQRFRGVLVAAQAPMEQQLEPYDVVFVVGAPAFEYYGYRRGTGAAMARVIQLTDDPAEAARAEATQSVIVDVAGALHDIVADLKRISPLRPESSDVRAQVPFRHSERLTDDQNELRRLSSGPISVEHLMAVVGRAVPPETFLVEESPSAKSAIFRFAAIGACESYVTTASGGLGFGLPAAVGIKLACPHRPVLCIVGDGSAMYSWQALWTAVQCDLPIAVIVVRNETYAMLKAFHETLGNSGTVPGLDLPGIDFVALAESMGCGGARAEHPDELPASLEWLFAARRPAVLEVRVAAETTRLF